MTAGSPGGLRGRRVVIANWRDPWHHLAGGSERYAWELATALREAGADVEFWTARDQVDGTRQGRRERVDGIDVVRGGGTFGFYPVAFLRLLRRRLSRAHRPALVVDMDCGIPLFAPLALGRRTPVVLVVHHVHLDQFATHFGRPLADLGRWLEGRLMPRVYRRVRTVAVSDSTVEEMRDQLRWRGAVDVVANGTDPMTAADDASEPDRVAVLGRLVPHKRVDDVVRAVADLSRQRPALRLDVIGTGPEADRLAGLVTRLGVADRVRLHGFVEDAELAPLLARARLHVCASDAEGWGQVVLTAAACGVPTLARDVPGLRDSVRPEETGWLLPAAVSAGRLPAALAEAMSVALDRLADAGERRAVAARCRAWAEQFSWPQMHEAIVEVAKEELQKSGQERPDGRVTAG